MTQISLADFFAYSFIFPLCFPHMNGNFMFISVSLLLLIALVVAGSYYFWSQSIMSTSSVTPSEDIQHAVTSSPRIAFATSEFNSATGTYTISVTIQGAAGVSGKFVFSVLDSRGVVVAVRDMDLNCTDDPCFASISFSLSPGIYELQIEDPNGKLASYYPLELR